MYFTELEVRCVLSVGYREEINYAIIYSFNKVSQFISFHSLKLNSVKLEEKHFTFFSSSFFFSQRVACLIWLNLFLQTKCLYVSLVSMWGIVIAFNMFLYKSRLNLGMPWGQSNASLTLQMKYSNWVLASQLKNCRGPSILQTFTSYSLHVHPLCPIWEWMLWGFIFYF